MELLLIRHGLPERRETEDGSPADPPLSAEGRDQAERLAAWLAAEDLEAVYASPLRRALDTAAPLLRGRDLELCIDPGVKEFDADSSVYVPLEELKATDRERWLELVQGGLYAGRDVHAFQSTVIDAIEHLIAAHPSGRIAVVCHGGVINAWAGHLVGSKAMFLFEPAYTSISRFLAARSGTRSLVSLNEIAHLR